MESHVGCYETGSLDFFGPLCVVACYVDQKDEKELNELELDKEMSTNDIEKIGKILKDKLTYSLLLLYNSTFLFLFHWNCSFLLFLQMPIISLRLQHRSL